MKKKNKEKSHLAQTRDNTQRIENIVDVIHDIVKDSPDYHGGVRVQVTLPESIENFYMISDMTIRDPFLEFFHLQPADQDRYKDLSLHSFPEKPEKQKLQTYVKNLAKDKRWNRIYEQIHLSAIVRIQTLGFYSYSKFWSIEENKPSIKIPKALLVPFRKD